MSDSVNGRNAYQYGNYGIWWCNGLWMLGYTSALGQCSGWAYTSEQDICVHDIGWDWKYSDNGWQAAGEGLGTRCTGISKFTI